MLCSIFTLRLHDGKKVEISCEGVLARKDAIRLTDTEGRGGVTQTGFG